MTFFVCLESWELCVWVLSLCCDPVVVPWCTAPEWCVCVWGFLLLSLSSSTRTCGDVGVLRRVAFLSLGCRIVVAIFVSPARIGPKNCQETSMILLGNAREVILNGKEVVVKWSGNGCEMLGEWSEISEKWFEMVVELPWHGREIVWFVRWRVVKWSVRKRSELARKRS